MDSIRPRGIKIIIALLLFVIAFNIGFILFVLQIGQMQGIYSLNILGTIMAAVAIIGLWKMKRWALWLTIAFSVFALVTGFFNLIFLGNQFHSLMGLPISRIVPFLMIAIIMGPFQIMMSLFILIYLFKRRTLFK